MFKTGNSRIIYNKEEVLFELYRKAISIFDRV